MLTGGWGLLGLRGDGGWRRLDRRGIDGIRGKEGELGKRGGAVTGSIMGKEGGIGRKERGGRCG